MSFRKTVLLTGVPFGFITALILGLSGEPFMTWLKAVLAGIASGVIFGFAMAYSFRWIGIGDAEFAKTRKSKNRLCLIVGSCIVFSYGLAYFAGKYSVLNYSVESPHKHAVGCKVVHSPVSQNNFVVYIYAMPNRTISDRIQHSGGYSQLDVPAGTNCVIVGFEEDAEDLHLTLDRSFFDFTEPMKSNKQGYWFFPEQFFFPDYKTKPNWDKFQKSFYWEPIQAYVKTAKTGYIDD